VKDDVRIAAPVGGPTTEPAIRQFLATFENARLDVFWFVDPATLDRFPQFRNARLIPVVADYGRQYASAGSSAVLRVDVGDGHLVPLRDAVWLLFQSCVDSALARKLTPG
jgi:hypothetical protein